MIEFRQKLDFVAMVNSHLRKNLPDFLGYTLHVNKYEPSGLLLTITFLTRSDNQVTIRIGNYSVIVADGMFMVDDVSQRAESIATDAIMSVLSRLHYIMGGSDISWESAMKTPASEGSSARFWGPSTATPHQSHPQPRSTV